MLGNYYYHEILRKTIIAFGTIFNDIHIRHRDGAGKETSDMRVPLAYGPMQKFLARLEQQADLNRAVQITLPRMSLKRLILHMMQQEKVELHKHLKHPMVKNLEKFSCQCHTILGLN